MAIGGAFLGGGVELVPAGSCKLELEILTEDRANLTAKFTITGGGNTYTVTAGSDGRAVYTVPSGQTYTVSVNTTGYDNLASQTVIAESGTIRYVRFDAIKGRVLRSGDTMTGDLSIGSRQNPIFIAKTNVKYGDARSSSKQIGGLRFQYANSSTNVGYVSMFHDTNTFMSLGVRYINENGATAKEDYLNIFINETEAYATTPSWSVGTDDNSNKIITMKMLNSHPKVVHTAGDETIGGRKTFTGYHNIYANWSLINLKASILRQDSTYPSSTVQSNISFNGVTKGEDGNDTDSTIWRLITNQTSTGLKNVIFTTNFKRENDSADYWKYPLRIEEQSDHSLIVRTVATPSTATSNEIATANWSLGKFVQKSGDTMTGRLNVVMSQYNPIRIDNPSRDRNAGTRTYGQGIYFRDSGGKDCTYLYSDGGVDTSGVSKSYCELVSMNTNSSSGNTVYATIRLEATSDGKVFANAPTWSVGTNDNSHKILTIQMANSLPTLVHTAGDEKIGGNKTFSGTNYFNNSPRVRPTSDIRRAIVFNKSSDGSEMGWIGYANDTSNMHINLLKGDSISLSVSPPSTANGTQIATANWVNNKLATKNRITEFSSYAELLTLIQNGKRGDSFGITIDYTGGSTQSELIGIAQHHSFGYYSLDEKTVSDGTMTAFEAFGSGEIQVTLDGTTYDVQTTGFGRLLVFDTPMDGFRGFYKGSRAFYYPNAAVQEEAVTSCTGYYISI